LKTFSSFARHGWKKFGSSSQIGFMPILSLENVTKDYESDGQRVRALNGVTLAVEAGQFVTLVGPKRMWKVHAVKPRWWYGFSFNGRSENRWDFHCGLAGCRPNADSPRKSGLHISVFSTAVHAFGF
jgi:hypothetical protein